MRVLHWKPFGTISGRFKLNPERVGYLTQKPLAQLDSIIKASSNEGAIMPAPFCGWAIARVAVDLLDRTWAAIALSPLAANLVRQRM